MPTASKVLIGLIIPIALGFIYLSTSVLEARRQWDAKIKAKEKEVAKVGQEIELFTMGSDEFQKEFAETIAKPVLALASKAANDEFQKKVEAGFKPWVAFIAAMNLFVDSKIVDAYQASVVRLNDLQKAPTFDKIEWDTAIEAYDAASNNLATSMGNLDQALAIFFGQTAGAGGIRGIMLKGMSVDGLRETLLHVRQLMQAQKAVFATMFSDGQKNETQMKDRWQEALAEAKTLQLASDNGEREQEERGKERDQLKIDLAKEKVTLADEEAKRDKAIAELNDLKGKFAKVTEKSKLLAQRVKEAEIRLDAIRGLKVVVSPDGRVYEGSVQKIDEAEGTIEINLGNKKGVRPGVQLHVFRRNPAKYLGILEVTKSESDMALGRMLPEYRQLAIQVGDRVSSEITRYDPTENSSGQ